jgi:multiple sugar transport system ATP-binding protein
MAEVTLDRLAKHFGDVAAVRDVSLKIAHNEFVVLVGPSGCGKSTTLRMIAGLEENTGGTVSISGRDVTDLPPRKRNVAMVFQNYALYPHMSVRGNLGFGLKLAGQPAAEIERRVREAAEILGLGHLLDRQPGQLSGGERQRVAMGRAIVRQPDVFLFDEPLSNLDAKLRTQMRTEIKRLHQKVQTTVIYVTHDQVEAMTLADRIVIMRAGAVEQEGAPEAIFQRPANVFVAQFVGSPPMNLFDAVVVPGDGGQAVQVGADWALPLPRHLQGRVAAGDRVVLGLRPDDLVPHGHGLPPRDKASFESTVAIAEPLGSETLLFLGFGPYEAVARMLSPRPVKAGERIRCDVNLAGMHLFDKATGVAIRGPSDNAGGEA